MPRGIRLARAELPALPALALHLLDPASLDAPLSGEGAHAAHVRPPYWALAWASGVVLARYVLENPALVRGKRVLDVGTGSGIVALAAAQSGAASVLAVDLDAHALDAARLNAEGLGLSLRFGREIPDERFDVALAADVLYDRENGALLDMLCAAAEHVLVAESRFPKLPHAAFSEVFAESESTYPDIGESETLRYVRVFRR